jgi:hypothetical protein
MTSFTAESTCDEVAQYLHEQIKGKIGIQYSLSCYFVHKI